MLLLLPDGHLPVRVEHGDLAPVGDASWPDAVLLAVVLLEDHVIVVQSRRESIAATVQGRF
jgi:hypothetical protein